MQRPHQRVQFALVLLLALLLPILAACGANSAAPSGTDTASAVPEASGAAPAEASASTEEPSTAAEPSADASEAPAESSEASEEPADEASEPAGATGEPAQSPVNEKVIVVGMNQEPDTFFGPESNALATSEVLFPTGNCITQLQYAYQPTYCFDGELPSFENGGAVTETVTVDPSTISEATPVEVGGNTITDTALAEEAGIEIPS